MDATQILSRDEIAAVLADLHRNKPARRSRSKWANLIIFRLSCCCGLRRKEICGLNLADLLLAGDRPYILVRKEITKGRDGKRRSRKVPLWWDAGTLADLREWKAFRIKEQHGAPDAPVVCGQAEAHRGKRLTPDLSSRRWRVAIRCLDPERVRQLHIHCGRHSFCSHSLSVGRSLIEVRDAAGHSNVSVTSRYLHAIDSGSVPDVFG